MLNQVPFLGPLNGLELFHYRIINEIGSGGMGVGLHTCDQPLDYNVTITVFHTGTITSEQARRHLYKENWAHSSLNYLNLAITHDLDNRRDVGSGEAFTSPVVEPRDTELHASTPSLNSSGQCPRY